MTKLYAHDQRLPFPTRPLQVGKDTVEEFIIPDELRQDVLNSLYLFSPVPDLDAELYDLHEDKLFRVSEYRVTWEHGQNWLVSPYYPDSGGTVIDWMPAEFAEFEETERENPFNVQ